MCVAVHEQFLMCRIYQSLLCTTAHACIIRGNFLVHTGGSYMQLEIVLHILLINETPHLFFCCVLHAFDSTFELLPAVSYQGLGLNKCIFKT